MKITKTKQFLLAPVAALIVACLLFTAFYPAFNPTPKEMPIAILNLDKGIKIQNKTQNIGKSFTEKVQDNKDIKEKVKFIAVKSKDELKEGFNHNDYYSALIIPETFTQDATSALRKEIQTVKMKEGKAAQEKAVKDIQSKIASGQITPQQAQMIQKQMVKNQKELIKKNASLLKPVEVKKAQLEIKVNQGASTIASQLSDTILTKMTENMNAMISKKSVTQLSKEKIKVNAQSMDDFINPVQVKHTVINKVQAHQANGNGTMLFFTPIWIASLITSVLLFFAFRSAKIAPKGDRLLASFAQIGMAVFSALFTSFASMWYVTQILDFKIDEPVHVAIYIFIAMFGFIMLILGLMSIIGFIAIPLFMLLLFFSMQLIMLPTQMLPKFYQDYIIGWNPFRLYADGLRDLIYLNKDISFNLPMQMYLGLGIFGVIAIIVASQVRKHREEKTV